MISGDLLLGLTGLAAYGASTGFEIELPNASRVSPAVSFGPVLIGLGASAAGLSSATLAIAALLVQFLIAGLLRRNFVATTAHAAGILLNLPLVLAFEQLRLRTESARTIGLVFVVAMGSLAYFGVDLYAKAFGVTWRGARRSVLVERVRAAVPVVIVLASTAGLIVLVLPLMGWATFVVMFVPVLATKSEFARWGRARRTYDETVRTLSDLAEGAGYVPQGHSARVAKLCVELGRELSLPPNRLHELELVGLLHDVGAVSLTDPAELGGVDESHLARSTSYLLQETEYLARYSQIVVDIAEGKRELPLEGKILRIADQFEALEGPPWHRLRSLAVSALPEDEEVVEALKRLVRVS